MPNGKTVAARLVLPLALGAVAAPAASADSGSHYRGFARVMSKQSHHAVHRVAKKVNVKR